jgi:PAS domain S-box-containing protein
LYFNEEFITAFMQSTAVETAATVLQIRQRAEQIRETNEVLKQRTKELRRELVVKRAALESTADAILVTDEKVKITDFNEKYIDMWKVPRRTSGSEMLREIWELTSQNFVDPQRFIARVEEVIATGQDSFDLLELKDGRILERNSKVLTVDGHKEGRVWNFRDVTERKLAEATSRWLGAIVATSSDAIIGKDLNGIVTSWNSGAERIFGYTADEMIGSSVMRLIPPDRQEEERGMLFQLQRGERVDRFETRVSVRMDDESTSLSRFLRSRIVPAMSSAHSRLPETSLSEKRRRTKPKGPTVSELASSRASERRGRSPNERAA